MNRFFATILLLIAMPSLCRAAQSFAPQLNYQKLATRAETEKSALAANPNASAEIKVLIADRLDLDFPKTEEDNYYHMLTFSLPPEVQPASTSSAVNKRIRDRMGAFLAPRRSRTRCLGSESRRACEW